MHGKYARMRLKIKILRYAVTYATYGATLNVLTYLLKPIKNWKMIIYLHDIAPLCQPFAFLRLCDKRTKNFFLFRYSEHTKKPQKTAKKLNNKTSELLEKLSQISKLDGPNENTVSCDYYNLMISRKLKKQDLAVLHLSISLHPVPISMNRTSYSLA